MPAPMISLSRRLRETPFTRRVTEAGVKGYTVYNHMLLPTVFDSIEADYHHLKQHVRVWDVACERQIEVRGPDAARLMQMLTPRDLRGMTPGQCYYVPIVDETGGMINDPVALKFADDKFYISIADSDLLLWVKGLAYGFRLDVDINEPDVSPLAVQGPKAVEILAALGADDAAKHRYYSASPMTVAGRKFIIPINSATRRDLGRRYRVSGSSSWAISPSNITAIRSDMTKASS